MTTRQTDGAAWGTGRWGLGGWGGGAADMSVVGAYALSTHEVVVTLSKPALARSGFLRGDGSAGGSWSITVPSTAQVLAIAGATTWRGDPTEWLLRTQDRLPTSDVTVRATATGLLSASGAAVGAANSADFLGVTELATSTPTAKASSRSGARDLSSRSAALAGGGQSLGGTLVIAAGDYALMDGTELAKKLIVRRLVATPGDFFHAPDYGCGFAVKQAIPTGDLSRARAAAERQIALEPDLTAVSVSLVQTMNTLTITVRATLARTGQQVTVALGTSIGQA